MAALVAVQATTGGRRHVHGASVLRLGHRGRARPTVDDQDAAGTSEIEVVGDEPAARPGASSVDDSAGIALAADAPPEPLTLTATTTLLGEVCGTTATPPADTSGPAAAARDLTRRRPTDAPARRSPSASDRIGPALTIGFVVGLRGGRPASLLPRPGARRRD